MPRPQYPKTILKRKKYWLFLKISGVFIGILGLAGTVTFIWFIKDLPRPEKFSEGIIPQTTKIYDRTGAILLYEVFGEEKRTIIALNEVPEFLKQAVVAVEDKNFFKHQGLDLRAIARAILYDLKLRQPIQGASTITQQLIRSYFLTRQKTIRRKTQEIILSLELEKRYSKEQILEWYLNLIPFGGNIYGAEEASRAFFGKHISEVSLPEAAVLAAVIRKPSYLSPYGEHLNELFERKNYVLERMFEQGYLNEKELAEAREQEINFAPKDAGIKAPHFVLFIKKYLEEKYGRDFLNRKGLKVYTSLNYELQETAEQTIKAAVKQLELFGAYNISLVSLDPQSGELLAMVGSKDYFAPAFPENCRAGVDCKFDPQVNTVLTSRQPGSALKPFVYAQAFQQGFTPNSIVWDVKTEFNLSCSSDGEQAIGEYGSLCYHPKNYDGKNTGPISLASALAQSRNVPAVKMLYLVGLKNFLPFIKNFGITTLKQEGDYGLSLVLGGGEVKLLELAEGYSVFANEGIKPSLVFIKKIVDSEGNILEESKIKKTRVIPCYVAQEINSILSNNVLRAPVFGWNSPLRLNGYEAAVKTGTTQDYRDGWIIGYTPQLVTGLWTGNNDNSPMSEKPAVSLIGWVWKNFMEKVLEDFPQKNFSMPPARKTGKPILDGIVQEKHCILYFINPTDPQYRHWETAVQNWLGNY